MASPTRERLISVAHDLFYRDGFHSTGLDRILAEVGVTKTTFYNHFPSKDDLMIEVLRQHDRWWRETFAGMLHRHGGDSPRGQLLAVFDALDELFGDESYNGCIFINVAVEFPMPFDPAHQAAAAHKLAMEALLRDLAARAGAADPAALAQEISLLMEGAYVTQQVIRQPTITDVARRIGRMLIERQLPAGPAATATSPPSADPFPGGSPRART